MSSREEHRRDDKERGRGERDREHRPRSERHREEPRRRRSSRSRSPRDRRRADRRDHRRDSERHRERDRGKREEKKKDEKPPAQTDEPEEGEEVEATSELSQAMMTAMGMAAFASTKVCPAHNPPCCLQTFFPGPTRRRQPGRRRQRQEVPHLAPVHEQVRAFHFPVQWLMCVQTGRLQ